jgi:dienelactone hydrolase
MVKSESIKRIFAISLVALMLVTLCSCKGKQEEETSLISEEATSVITTVQNVTEPTDTTEPTQPTSDSTTTGPSEQATEPTDNPESTETVTQPWTETATETVAPTGVQTITDSNKTIVYPAALASSQYKYPVVSWANGTGCPTQLYQKVIEAIANAGYIVVADSTTMSGDGTAQIDSINYIINKNSDYSSVFYNKVDTVNIGVCGQSQGGRSCINAAQNDSRIRAVVSIAGASTADESSGLKTPCLFLTATNDNIVKSESWCLPSYNAVSGRAAYASLKGGNHLSFNSMSGYAIDWFNAYLKNDSTAKAVFTDGGKLANDSAWQDFKNKN